MKMIYRVYRVVAQGQDGNRGAKMTWIASFPDKDKAEEYADKDREQCGVHPGWLSYYIREIEREL